MNERPNEVVKTVELKWFGGVALAVEPIATVALHANGTDDETRAS
jgi:hypothetical protein